jgi:enoyl-CoA hydratase/carnithine racemase
VQPELIKTELVEDTIALVRLDNPPVNAHSQQLLEEIAWTFDSLSDREDVRVEGKRRYKMKYF